MTRRIIKAWVGSHRGLPWRKDVMPFHGRLPVYATAERAAHFHDRAIAVEIRILPRTRK